LDIVDYAYRLLQPIIIIIVIIMVGVVLLGWCSICYFNTIEYCLYYLKYCTYLSQNLIKSMSQLMEFLITILPQDIVHWESKLFL